MNTHGKKVPSLPRSAALAVFLCLCPGLSGKPRPVAKPDPSSAFAAFQRISWQSERPQAGAARPGSWDAALALRAPGEPTQALRLVPMVNNAPAETPAALEPGFLTGCRF